MAGRCYLGVSNPVLNLNGSQIAHSALWSGALQGPFRKLRVSRWKDYDQGRPWWRWGSLLKGQKLFERGQPFLASQSCHQNPLAWNSKSPILQILGGRRLPGPKAFSASQEILAGLCCGLFRRLETVGSSPSRFVSQEKCVPSRLP